MPPVTITDMQIRQNDLVVSTQGRGFWILDGLHVLQQARADIADSALHLFTPEQSIRWTSFAEDTGSGDPTAEAKQRGAVLNYYISNDVKLDEETLTIDILNESGEVVRHFSSEETDNDKCRIANAMLDNPPTIERPEPKPGLNRWVWDLHHDPLYCPPNVRLSSGFYGPRVLPGTYSVRVSLADITVETSLSVVQDPSTQVSQAQFSELANYLDRASALFASVMRGVSDIRAARAQIQAQIALTSDHAKSARIKELGNAATEQIDAWEETVTSPEREASQDEIRVPNRLDAQIRYLIEVLDMNDAPVTPGSKERLADLDSLWAERRRALTAIGNNEISAFNNALVEIDALHVPLP